MPLAPGDKLGPYEILAPLGAGGMGQVYRARDLKLNRDVAIKVLSPAFADDAERMQRFEREAQVLASLNHPNIAQIYGVEQGAIVMELVEGADLKGPLPLDTVLEYARQIAAGLDAAHEKGIIHRDLKPANIKVTPEGTVKLLDFGLAKSAEPSAASTAVSPTMSPTLSLAMTQTGMILGTAAYMSPEQARGKPVDKRTDIWAFGVVLYELITGRLPFQGEDLSHTMASVILQEADYDGIPAALRRLIEGCLEKNPKKRLRDIGDVWRLMDEGTPAPVAAPASAVRRGLSWWAAAVPAVAALGFAAAWWMGTRPVPRPLIRFSVDLGSDAVAGTQITAILSPDGSRIVYPVKGPGGQTQLATRLLDQPKGNILSGTENAEQPFFKPDGQWIGFFADQKLKKISIQGGAAVALADTIGIPRGASWGDDGNIIANLDNRHLFRVPEGGGPPQPLPKPEDHGERSWRFPQVLPGSRQVIFTGSPLTPGFGYEDANVEILDLKTGQVKIIQRGGYFGRYFPTGHLTYLHQSTLFAVPFDLSRMEARATPQPVVEEVAGASGQGGGQFDFSDTGTLAYLSGKSPEIIYPISWQDGAGKLTPALPGSVSGVSPKLSPDGKFLAYSDYNDIMVFDLQRSAATKLTFSATSNRQPVWTPDGKHIVYSGGGLFWVSADGSTPPEKLFSGPEGLFPNAFTPDGRNLLFTRSAQLTSRIEMLPLDLSDPNHPKPGAPRVFLEEEDQNVGEAALSPDGQWLAYSSFATSVGRVFVRRYGAAGSRGRWQIDNAGGRTPLWSRTGKQLFYISRDNRIMSVRYMAKGAAFAPEKPEPWSPVPLVGAGAYSPYDVAPDGKRMIVLSAGTPEERKGSLHVTVLLNFFDELRRKAPVGK